MGVKSAVSHSLEGLGDMASGLEVVFFGIPAGIDLGLAVETDGGDYANSGLGTEADGLRGRR